MTRGSTQQKTDAYMTTLELDGKNQHISPNISVSAGLIVTKLSAMVDICMRIIKLILVVQ